MQSQMNMPHGVRNEDLQYAFDALIKGRRSRNGRTNAHNSRSTPPPKKSRFGPDIDGYAKPKEYDVLSRSALHGPSRYRIDKCYSNSRAHTAPPASEKKGRYGDNKIMLPAPPPLDTYLAQAAEEPSTIDSPRTLLVILDLNGTVLFRPNRNAQTMIERPFLKPFLRYLFQNFKVMVWSSAKPDNVKALVNKALDNDLRSKLVAQWARDSFGLSPTNYQQNVQVYKNLRLVWSRDVIQQHHPEYAAGERFGQHNTVLIDDSALKANAQPHNLLEIPEFSATPEQMEGDALREVAGYLEELRHQADVSRYIKRVPFVGGRWTYEWPAEVAGDGEVTTKVSAKKNKKNKKKQGNTAAHQGATETESSNESKDAFNALETPVDASAAPLSDTIASLSSVTLAAPAQKDW